MGLTYRTQTHSSIVLMALGVLALTVGADVAPQPSTGTALAVGGGLVVTVAGVWGFRLVEQRDDFDERYLKIGLRAAAIALWAFYWAASVVAALDRSGGIATPVLDPLTWLMMIPFVVFFVTALYYSRVM
ncbi:hypothetical protein SAMN06269185_2688 [Natronoarchaeum philippinense]|uniref:Uncharacterized protein n=1 Tax=Natronoarchaeum philippinense TaxID=558529 RepID=A0A285P2W2_NATPI|nr:hypothetical protein [Natronoarchaeum philippinense]SNZ16070.1 hypothetical protein SAMN06269185_2688 [Natronoarchaeum philippinense]